MEVSIIGDVPGKTFTTGGELILTEINNSYWIQLTFYRMVFTATNYTNGEGLHMGGDTHTNLYYNCVFLSKVGGWNGGCRDASVNTYNCEFLGGASNVYSSYAIKGVAQNCASKDTTIAPKNGTKETCMTNVAFDKDYYIESDGWYHTGTGTNPDGTQANIGVYGGDYAWTLENGTYKYLGANYQVFETPKTGYYRIDCYGASGGQAVFNSTYLASYGTGGHASGVIKLTQGEKLYIYVGQQGANGIKTKNTLTATSFNGGGAGTGDSEGNDGGGGGRRSHRHKASSRRLE